MGSPRCRSREQEGSSSQAPADRRWEGAGGSARAPRPGDQGLVVAERAGPVTAGPHPPAAGLHHGGEAEAEAEMSSQLTE